MSKAVRDLVDEMGEGDTREITVDLVGAAPVEAMRAAFIRAGRLQGKHFKTRYNRRTGVLTVTCIECHKIV